MARKIEQQVKVTTGDSVREIAKVEEAAKDADKAISDVDDSTITVDADAALAELADIQAKAKALADRKVELRAELDAAGFTSEADNVKRKMDDLDEASRRADGSFRAQTSSFTDMSSAIGESGVTMQIDGVGQAFEGIADAAEGFGARMGLSETAISRITTAATGAIIGLGAINLAVSLGTTLWNAWQSKAEKARQEQEQFNAAVEKALPSMEKFNAALAEGDRRGAWDALVDGAEAAGLSLEDLRTAGFDLSAAYGDLANGSSDYIESLRAEKEANDDLIESYRSREADALARSDTDEVRAVQRSIAFLKERGATIDSNINSYNILTGAQSDATTGTWYLNKEMEEAIGASGDLTDATKDVADATGDATEQWHDANDALKELTDTVLSSFDANIAYEDAVADTADAIVALTEANGDATLSEQDKAQALRDAESAALDQASSALANAEAWAQANGATLTANDRNKILRDELNRVKSTLDPSSPLAQALQGYIDQLGSVPDTVDTSVTADTTEAQRKVDELVAYIRSRNAAVSVGIVGRGGAGYGGGIDGLRASGGPVRPGGTYLVGEEGPELLTMGDQSGYVTPNGRLAGGTTYIINVSTLDPRSAADAVKETIQLINRREGTAWMRG